MPVVVQDGDGALVMVTFTNVRCVPEFKFTLLSVRQLWNGHLPTAMFDEAQLRSEGRGHGKIFASEISRKFAHD